MVPDFYKNTLGSSIVYCLVPLIKLDITNHDTYLKMLGFNLVCTFIASLFFWEVYDFDSWLWTLDSYIARAFGINCFINNVIHLTSYHSCFFSAAPIFLYSLGFLTKDKEDYKSTLLLHILFRYLLFCNSVLLLDNNKYDLIKTMTPLYITTCATIYNFDRIGYWKSVGYVVACVLTRCFLLLG